MNKRHIVLDKYVHETIKQKQRQKAKMVNINVRNLTSDEEELEYMQFLSERRNGLL